MQNPYYIDDLTNFELRDARGRYSSPSRAKRFYIYHNGQLLYAGEFSRVSLPVKTKEDIIIGALQEALASMSAKALKVKKPKKKQAVEQTIEEIEEIRESDDELYEELLREIAKTDKKFARELKKQVYEDFDEDEVITTPEELYKDLLDIIGEEDPFLFEELTGFEVPINGTVSEEYVEYLSYSLGDWQNDDIASAQKFEFLLDTPIVIDSKAPQDMINLFEKNIKAPLRRVFEESLDGHNLYLFTLIYDMKINNTVVATKGWGIARVEARDWDDFQVLVVDEIYSQFKTKYRRYLERSFDKKMIIKGFGLENLYDTESGRF